MTGGPQFRLVITESRLEHLETVLALNRLIFEEDRLINTFDHEQMLVVLAYAGETPAGFKVGYNLSATDFYSAKGGVLPAFRRQGLAGKMMHLMMQTAARAGYSRFVFDTFPNLYRPMLILGLKEGFTVESVQWNPTLADWQMRLAKPLL